MKAIATELNGVVIIEPDIFEDSRGNFSVTYSKEEFSATVCDIEFVQDNQSVSKYGVIRGLHYQLPPYAQAKLVRVVRGCILDVAVDIRRSSPDFGKHVAVELSAENHRQLFIPAGFAHGFSALSDEAIVQYKCDSHYAPTYEGGIAFNDPRLGIDWRIPEDQTIVSDKDRNRPVLEEATLFE